MKVVHVKWVDPAFGSNGWVDRDDFEAAIKRGLSRGDTVGMLAYANDDFIVVLQTAGDTQVSGWVKIARTCITDMHEIAEVDIKLELNLPSEIKS